MLSMKNGFLKTIAASEKLHIQDVHVFNAEPLQAQTNKIIDQQNTLFFLLSWPIFPLGGKWGNFVYYVEFVQTTLLYFKY